MEEEEEEHVWSSGQYAVDMARQGTLISILKAQFEHALVEHVLMPYCRWSFSVKRRLCDDFDDWQLTDERDKLLPWNLFGRSGGNDWIATFHGFFSPLEIGVHLAQAQLQSRVEEEARHQQEEEKEEKEESVSPVRFSRLAIGADQVRVALSLLNKVLKGREKILQNKYGNDLVRLLLDLFLPVWCGGRQSPATPFAHASYILVRVDELDVYNHISFELANKNTTEILWNAAGHGKTFQPQFTVSHPEFSTPPPSSKKSKHL
jgi:hypothetical protein